MKKSIKKAVLKRLLSDKQYKKLYSENILFPGGTTSIKSTNDNDVFIVGFPKSGNTLMQHLIAHLVYGLNEVASRSMVNLIVPDIYANSHYFRFNDVCFFKTHDLPKPEYKKVIYIIRDGRDALLSYYHMMENMGTPVSLEDLYLGRIKLFNATWSEHIQQWEQNPYNSEILWVKFEDLKKNKYKELERISQFLNIERSPEELQEVIKFSSLDHMKELEKRQDWVKMNNFYFKKNKGFLRNGKVNSHKDNVSSSLIDVFVKENKEVLSKYFKSIRELE